MKRPGPDSPSPRRASRRREALTRERILGEALALIDTQGLAGFSMRALAERLRVEAMSLYHHFASKQHLFDALVDDTITSMQMPDAEQPPLEQLRQLAHAYRAMARSRPALYPLVAIHRLNTPAGVRWIDAILGVFHRVVPDDELAGRHFRAMGYFLMGCGLDETSGYAKGPSAAEPVTNAYIAEHCPRLVAAAKFFQPDHWDRTFDLGLEALLAAAERDGAQARARPGRGGGAA